VFQKNKQIDLANYYAAHDKIGIPFKIGYGYSRERPNLLLAIPRRFVAKASATKAAGSFSSPGRAYPDFVALAHSFVRKNGNGGGCSCNKKARPRELPQIPPVEERFLLPIPPDIVELWIHWPNARLQIRRSH
ncbi:MAG: hypothetical protein LBP41_02470, partial [Holosporaceae bacterium]|nr:hypothetical protein [Holosporaceae bacterium]